VTPPASGDVLATFGYSLSCCGGRAAGDRSKLPALSLSEKPARWRLSADRRPEVRIAPPHRSSGDRFTRPDACPFVSCAIVCAVSVADPVRQHTDERNPQLGLFIEGERSISHSSRAASFCVILRTRCALAGPGGSIATFSLKCAMSWARRSSSDCVCLNRRRFCMR
jgi:hypothetical protein